MILVGMLAVALVATIGVAAAALSRDLKIDGTATVKGTSWNVHFDNLKPASVVSPMSTAKETKAPTLDATKTTIGNYEVELRNTGDSVTYTFDVKNDGDIDAKVTNIVMNNGATLTCTSTAGDTAAQNARNTKTCANLSYTLTYADNTPVSINDVLQAGATKIMKLKLEYKLASGQTDADLPDDDVVVSGLGLTITYGQN